MKKIIVKLIAVIMLVMIAFAGTAMAEGEENLTGTWYLSSMEMEGQEIDASFIAAMGMEMTVVLNEDGTAYMEMSSQSSGDRQSMEGSWKLDGSRVIMMMVNTVSEEVEIELMADGETLRLDQGGQIGIFRQDRPAAGAADLAPVVENPDLSDFNGAWNATTYVTLGIPLPVSMLGADFSIAVEDGRAEVTVVSKDLENGGEITGTLNKEVTAQLTEEGTLYVDFGGEEIITALQMTGDGIYLTLHEDGRLSGEIPAMTEMMKALSAMSAESENTQAEGAEAAEPAEGDSGSSGGSALEIYFVFEKAE